MTQQPATVWPATGRDRT